MGNHVFTWAGRVGGAGFAAGFFGPMMFSDASLGPLLGIFVTGPLGALFGAAVGIILAARSAGPRDARPVLSWLAGLWLLSLLWTLSMMSMPPNAAPAIGAQAATVLTGVFVLYRSRAVTHLPASLLGARAGLVLAGFAIMVLSAFPPVGWSPWIPDVTYQEWAEGDWPTVAFVLDSRYSGAYRAPLFGVDRRALVAAWAVTLLTALLFSLSWSRLVGSRREQPGSVHEEAGSAEGGP